ncbi:50S ribosomal protein L25/general stress protein Ctc [Sphingomonas morindae]|uniref:Large ribosomal subunit protein bL25 n=1 Tax=Sphingomonas morindae TaxID=1541170 RepID=A0ABY4X5T2_9SPHN|nr:50S ribosomal protein L25/general stress protein Ctc [Sphingomonas morindae]USI72263.1 50S ribosomal protein L25/general stress protein Ctc [Sphingomonas morindae]
MSDQLTLSAEPRDRAGKGASRHLRREGRVPAVIYGDKKTPVSISLNERELAKALGSGHFMNSVVMIEADGQVTRTLPKDVQFHPVSDRPLHVDFLRIGEHSTVTVAVPLRFTNEDASPGIKRGGVLSIVRHEVELIVDAAEIPDEIVVDVTGYEVGDSIHISAVALPRGAKPAIEDRDFTVATITAPSALKSAEGEAEDAGDTAGA